MILGIITGCFLLYECCFLFVKRSSKLHGFHKKLHCPIGIILSIITVFHFILSLQLIKQRPVGMYITGALLLICSIAQIFVFVFKSKIKCWLKVHKTIAISMVVLLCVHIYLGISSFSSYQQNVSEINISDNMTISNISNGRYIGECDAGYIYTKVAVLIENGEIKNIDILEHNNERGATAESITDEIIKKNQIDVDAVTNATNSSKVIKKAIENALNVDNENK